MATRSCRATSSRRVWARSLASRFESGSSIRNTSGWLTMARPRATRWRWPPDRAAGLRPSSSLRPRVAGRVGDVVGPLGLGQLAGLGLTGHPDLAGQQRRLDVLGHRHVRVERVALEHHRDVAVLGLDVVDDPIADAQRALGGGLEPGDHAQGGGLAAARRAEQHHELLVQHLEVEPVDGGRRRRTASSRLRTRPRSCWRSVGPSEARVRGPSTGTTWCGRAAGW